MTFTTVAEVSARSNESFEDAVNRGFDCASSALFHVEGAWVRNMKVILKDGGISEYRVEMKLTGVVDE